MITQFSRYADASVVNVSVNGQTRQVIVPDEPQAFTIVYRTYILTDADTLDGLADQFYGMATLWWKIADANPEILDWLSLTPGTAIRIPVTA